MRVDSKVHTRSSLLRFLLVATTQKARQALIRKTEMFETSIVSREDRKLCARRRCSVRRRSADMRTISPSAGEQDSTSRTSAYLQRASPGAKCYRPEMGS